MLLRMYAYHYYITKTNPIMHGQEEDGEALSLSQVRVKSLIQLHKHTLSDVII